MSYRKWLKINKNKSVVDYYKQHINTPPASPTGTLTAKGNTLTTSQLNAAYKSLTTTTTVGQQKAYMTASQGASSPDGSWGEWTKEEEKLLANVGFNFDETTKTWTLDITATVKIPQLVGLQMMGKDYKPTKQMVTHLKELKRLIIEKITAKTILAELTRPRDIKQ